MGEEWLDILYRSAKRIVDMVERKRTPAPAERIPTSPPNDPIQVTVITRRGETIVTHIDPADFEQFKFQAMSWKGVKISRWIKGRTRTNTYKYCQSVTKDDWQPE